MSLFNRSLSQTVTLSENEFLAPNQVKNSTEHNSSAH